MDICYADKMSFRSNQTGVWFRVTLEDFRDIEKFNRKAKTASGVS
jgi:hypothetical protein